MRVRALDRAGPPLPIILAFVVAAGTFTFCLLMAIIVLVAAWSQPAKAQEIDEPISCLVSQSVFAKAMAETHHPLLFRFPPDLARRFIAGWNAAAQNFQVPMTSDAVSLYGWHNDNFYKLAFFKKGCLVESIDMPASEFWQVVGVADNSKWRI